MRTALVAVVIALASLAVACGSDDQAATDDADPEVEQSDGAAVDGEDDTGDAAPADLGDFAIAVPPGAVVTSDGNTNGARLVLVSMPAGDFDTTVAFYDDWTAEQSDQYQRTEAEAGGVSWVTENHVIQVLSPLDGDDEITITLTVASS